MTGAGTNRFEIEYVPVDSITPYPNNPRIHEDVKVIVNSIEAFDFIIPIVVDSDYQIIDGHGRWESAKNLGLTEVPVIVASNLDELSAKAFRLVANRSTEVGNHWDFELLGFELQDLEDAFDMSDFGFEDEEEEPAESPELGGKEEPRCKCPECSYRGFLSEFIVRDEDDGGE